MDKKKLHHALTLLRKIHYGVLLGLCIVFAVIAVFALRANNQRMIQLRAAVFTADEKNGDVEAALRSLRQYVFAHMNTNLSSGDNAVKPPIQLKYHYERLQTAAKVSYEAANTAMLNDAQNTCVARFPGSVFSQARLDCAKAYATAHPITQASIPEDQYKFDFASPAWSPDVAGWSLVCSGLSLLLLALRYLSDWLIKRSLG